MRQPERRNGDHRVPKVVWATLNKQNRQALVSFRKSACDNAASSAACDPESMMVEIYRGEVEFHVPPAMMISTSLIASGRILQRPIVFVELERKSVHTNDVVTWASRWCLRQDWGVGRALNQRDDS